MDIEKSLRKIDEALAMAREKLVHNVNSGATGVVVVKFPLFRGGVRDITCGEEIVLGKEMPKDVRCTKGL